MIVQWAPKPYSSIEAPILNEFQDLGCRGGSGVSGLGFRMEDAVSPKHSRAIRQLFLDCTPALENSNPRLFKPKLEP